MPYSKTETTQLLQQLVDGNRAAAEQLFTRLYDDLRERAKMAFRAEQKGHTWQPTALVHEAFLRMIDQRSAKWQNRAHFSAVFSQVMRRILVDHAREKRTEKRGKDWQRIPFTQSKAQVSPNRPDDVLLVDELIEELSAVDPRQAEIVKFRFFGGLTVQEVAAVLGVSRRTVEAEWTMIRATVRRKVENR